MIYLLQKDELILKGVRPDKPEFSKLGASFKRIGVCLCGLAAKERKPLYSTDIHADPRCVLDGCRMAGVRFFAALPILEGDKILGVMGLASLKTFDFSGKSAFLEVLTQQVAVSLQNALLHEKLQSHAAELEKSLANIKVAQEALGESEKKYVYLFEHSQTINILLSTDGKIIDVNESAVNALGYRKSEITGKDAMEFIVQKDRERAAENLTKDFSGEYTPPIELSLIAKSGIHTFLFSGGHAPLFEKGRQVGILLSAADVTEHKKYEDALKESERKYSNLVEKGNDGIIIRLVAN